MHSKRAAESLRDGFREVYANRLRALTRPDGKCILTVPQPTLEGGDISLFVDAADGTVLLHDNGRTSLFLHGLGVDLGASRRMQIERLAKQRGCEYRLGRLQVSYSLTDGGVAAALGLVDTIKTVSDLGLQPRPRPSRERPLAKQVKGRLSQWYPPTVMHAPWRIRGEVTEHIVEVAVVRGGRWCAVKAVEGKEIVTQAANWLGAWRDLWLGHVSSSDTGSDGLAGGVSIYPTAGVASGEVNVVRDILGRLGPENTCIPAERLDRLHDAIESVFRANLL